LGEDIVYSFVGKNLGAMSFNVCTRRIDQEE
jgi:hypothetical protein